MISNSSQQQTPLLPQEHTRILIIIINWQHYPVTLRCLENLKAVLSNLNSHFSVNIALIENGSTNDSLEQIEKYLISNISYLKLNFNFDGSHLLESNFRLHKQELFFLISSHNTGFSGGVNLGARLIQFLSFDYCLLLNNDAEIVPETLRQLVEVSRVHHNNAIVGPAMYESPTASNPYFLGKVWPGFLFGSTSIPPSIQGIRRSAYVEGSCMLIPTALIHQRFHEQGYLMDDQMFLYCEDVDLCRYANSKGILSLVTENAKAFHEISKSSGGAGNSTAYYYITRNRILLAKKWLSSSGIKFLFYGYYVVSRLLLIPIRYTFNSAIIAQAQWEGLRDGIKGQWGPRK